MSPQSDLDEKSREVLEAIWANEEQATTTDIKEYTGIEASQVVIYRFEKLKKRGLIEVEQPDGYGGANPPKVAELTEKGQQNVETIIDAGKPPLSKQMDDTREAFSDLRDEVYSEIGEAKELTARVEDVEQRLDEIQQQLDEERENDEALRRVESLEDEMDDLVLALGGLVRKTKDEDHGLSFEETEALRNLLDITKPTPDTNPPESDLDLDNL